jgi:hypothetical protein
MWQKEKSGNPFAHLRFAIVPSDGYNAERDFQKKIPFEIFFPLQSENLKRIHKQKSAERKI